MQLVIYYMLLISGIQARDLLNYKKLYKYFKYKNNNCTSESSTITQLPSSYFQTKQAQQKEFSQSQPLSQQTEFPQPQPQQTEIQQPQQTEIPQPKQNGAGDNLQTTSKASFYFRVGPDVEGCPSVQTFNDGNSYGPCNGGQGVKYTSESKYWVAIKNASSRCGQTITVNYNGKTMNLQVMDQCPGCEQDNHVDMSLDALIELTGSKEAACAINTVPPMITWF